MPIHVEDVLGLTVQILMRQKTVQIVVVVQAMGVMVVMVDAEVVDDEI